ncbi:hypothetical protein KY290_031037 [Solanum tuberosum]|uniref:Uncharacterized protein n=1 Tax=Solanum tuberosum TaxID=4113 RepID=A0ABQ7U9X2_SOLTU|nr:hypothetical protein KY290_031037 [Solanum tuberosum]
MRDGVRNEKGSRLAEDFLDNTFDRTFEVELPPSNDSGDDEEDNTRPRWALHRRMVPVSNKGKEKVVEETLTKKPSTRCATQKLMSDAMKVSKASTTEIRRRREICEEEFVVPAERVVDVSNEQSENDMVSKDITLASELRRKEEQ